MGDVKRFASTIMLRAGSAITMIINSQDLDPQDTDEFAYNYVTNQLSYIMSICYDIRDFSFDPEDNEAYELVRVNERIFELIIQSDDYMTPFKKVYTIAELIKPFV